MQMFYKQENDTTGLPRQTMFRRVLTSLIVLAALLATIPVTAQAAGTATAGSAAGNAPKAKAVIQIWLWGGPSHIDTFDPKPAAGPDYTGPYTTDIATNVPGMRISAKLPLLAAMADKFSLVRSMTHGINGHETAAYIMQTGHDPGGLVYPSLGAVVAYNQDPAVQRKLPPYIVLTETQGRFAEEGFLGPRYKPFITGGDPARQPFAVEGIVSVDISDERQKQRQVWLNELDSLGKASGDNPFFSQHREVEQRAWETILGDGRKVFDLSQEPAATRERYGKSTFGQSCLAARRLVEAGVVYITINAKGWDTHKQHFQALDQKLPELDQGLSALLQDLEDKKLLDTTIIWCGGEFGRTPRVQWEAPWNGGRNHFGPVFSVLLAGGGFKGGRVVGETDARAETVAARPVYPRDLLSSILIRLGIDPATLYPTGSAKGQPLMPPSSDKPGTGILKELWQ